MDYNKLCVNKLREYYKGQNIDEFEYYPDTETEDKYNLIFLDHRKVLKTLSYDKKRKFFSMM